MVGTVVEEAERRDEHIQAAKTHPCARDQMRGDGALYHTLAAAPDAEIGTRNRNNPSDVGGSGDGHG